MEHGKLQADLFLPKNTQKSILKLVQILYLQFCKFKKNNEETELKIYFVKVKNS